MRLSRAYLFYLFYIQFCYIYLRKRIKHSRACAILDFVEQPTALAVRQEIYAHKIKL